MTTKLGLRVLFFAVACIDASAYRCRQLCVNTGTDAPLSLRCTAVTLLARRPLCPIPHRAPLKSHPSAGTNALAAGGVFMPVSGLSSTTAAGLARRFTDGQWRAVETGIATWSKMHDRVVEGLKRSQRAGELGSQPWPVGHCGRPHFPAPRGGLSLTAGLGWALIAVERPVAGADGRAAC